MSMVESVRLPVMLKSGTPGLRKLAVFPVTSSRLSSYPEPRKMAALDTVTCSIPCMLEGVLILTTSKAALPLVLAPLEVVLVTYATLGDALTVASASAFGITLAPLDPGPVESTPSRTGNSVLKSTAMKFPYCALIEVPLVVNQLVLKYPVVPRKLMSFRKV